jgi:HK97 family phage prohead protease
MDIPVEDVDAAIDKLDADRRARKAELLLPVRGISPREVRQMPTSHLECRSYDGVMTFNGVASSTDSPYDMGFYTETIERGAFDKSLAKRPDVMLLTNHEGLPLARTTNGSLQLSDMGNGLEFRATAPADDPDVKRIASKIEAGLMDQCSFAFRVVEQTWNEDYTERSIGEVNLDRGDVSIVNYGANPNTQVTVRSLLAHWDEVSQEDIDELRQALGLPSKAEMPILSAPLDDDPVAPNLYTYQARATALALRRR